MLRLVAGEGRGAIYALDRVPDTVESTRNSYSCALLLDTGREDWSNTMLRISPSKYRRADYILRAYQPADSKNLLLFLWAAKPEKIKEMRLEFEGLAKICTTNQCGIALLTGTSPHDLDGQVVHTTVRKSSNGYLTTRIKKLNLLHTI